MRIAVISDTHDRLPLEVRQPIAAADEIWHLGDVTDPSIIEMLRQIGPPLKVVRGNCDGSGLWPLTLDFTVAGFRVRLIHIPPRQPPPDTDLLLHGHTHVPRDETIGGTRFLNPGCVNKANKGAPPSFGWLQLEEGQPARWRIERLAVRTG